MGAMPKPIRDPFEFEGNFNRNPRVIQLRPYLSRDGRRIPGNRPAPSSSEMMGGRVNPEEISLQAVFEMLNEMTLPKIILKMIQGLFQEAIREQKAKSAFAKADAEFSTKQFEQLLVEDENPTACDTAQNNKKRSSDSSTEYEKERTRRIISLTGKMHGDITDVLNWEI